MYSHVPLIQKPRLAHVCTLSTKTKTTSSPTWYPVDTMMNVTTCRTVRYPDYRYWQCFDLIIWHFNNYVYRSDAGPQPYMYLLSSLPVSCYGSGTVDGITCMACIHSDVPHARISVTIREWFIMTCALSVGILIPDSDFGVFKKLIKFDLRDLPLSLICTILVNCQKNFKYRPVVLIIWSTRDVAQVVFTDYYLIYWYADLELAEAVWNLIYRGSKLRINERGLYTFFIHWNPHFQLVGKKHEKSHSDSVEKCSGTKSI